MTVQDDQVGGKTSASRDDQTQKIQNQPVSGTLLKEQESKPIVDGEEEKIVAQITTRGERLDSETIDSLRSSISEAKLATPEPKVPPEVGDIGLKAPQEEADSVVSKGATIQLPATEQEYKTGLHQKVKAIVVDKVVVGASSLFALATLVGRLIKIAHKHTLRIVFRKGGQEDAN
ncbi:hypothetical protein A2165_01450 [Candidatus Curtissbacteria bacterium RBG_13_40_7]|uniref:Uncharacterized protein n=1 Tax=Candidatus Curtissbacteria bacterium RBG_13_40_7 TaxID=1797706 RepID=A0A1F5FY27_9BACT|nr:MAG: hypothetical protein A2165_01450 [Candidatus Curtissbacteria bacterium RBG_13_40_7]